MTHRLYYDDCYTVDFSAQIVEHLTVNEHQAVVLDQTCFYPTGGGQPHDRGQIAGVNVVDVFTRDEDRAVVHVLESEPRASGDPVAARVDWARRFDHMQHHTGQHILTQAFVSVVGAHTVGFHLSENTVTIDLDRTDLSVALIAEAESVANRVLQENRPVSVQLVDPDDLDGVRMRKLPRHLLTKGLRVVEVEDFDVTACGGTHVRQTGEIGIIKVLRADKRGDKTRIEFVCGGRALNDYRAKNGVIDQLTAALTCGQDEVVAAVERLQTDLKDQQRVQKALTNQLLDYEAEALVNDALLHVDIRIVMRVYAGRSVAELRMLASKLTEAERTIALLAAAGDKSQLIFARSDTLNHDMNQLLRSVLPQIDGARGGGRPNQAQGGGVPATVEQLESLLSEAERTLLSE